MMPRTNSAAIRNSPTEAATCRAMRFERPRHRGSAAAGVSLASAVRTLADFVELQRRHEARDDEREQRRDGDGDEHRGLEARVDAQFRPLAERRFDRRQHRRDEPLREQDREQRAAARDDAAFDELLADELPA